MTCFYFAAQEIGNVRLQAACENALAALKMGLHEQVKKIATENVEHKIVSQAEKAQIDDARMQIKSSDVCLPGCSAT